VGLGAKPRPVGAYGDTGAWLIIPDAKLLEGVVLGWGAATPPARAAATATAASSLAGPLREAEFVTRCRLTQLSNRWR
jgi:hypothetical protein